VPARKIATCCYCGTRAALVLAGEGRHELSCSRCGAPLHELKMLPIASERAAAPAAAPTRPKAKSRPEKPKAIKRKPAKKPKKRKGLAKRAVSELWDFVEDIFD
jgi:hypothetical protein